MTTTTLPASAGRMDALRHMRIGPYLFVVALALIVYVVIGPQQFVNALTIGGIYALVALGYTMVYGIIELINFAHGDNFMIGSFVGLTVLSGTILGKLQFDANGDTSQKIISIYAFDPAGAEGKGDWVFKEQVDFAAAG